MDKKTVEKVVFMSIGWILAPVLWPIVALGNEAKAYKLGQEVKEGLDKDVLRYK